MSEKKIIFKKTESQKTESKRGLYQYPIDDVLIQDFNKINLDKLTTVFLCIFNINDCFDSEKTYHPFLEYYLWKYPKSNKKNSDLFIFPFIKYKKNKTINQIATDLLKKLNKDKTQHKDSPVKRGFIQSDNSVYLFYEFKGYGKKWQMGVSSSGGQDTGISRNNKTWWVVMDEICNSRRVLNFPIHNSVTEIFYKNPKLIHLLDTQNHKLETPIIAYYGNYYKLLPMNAVFGRRHTSSRAALFGSHYYFGTYNAAIRHAGWSSIYSKKKFKNTTISNDSGKHTQGGIIRFVLFLGKLDVRLNQPVDKSMLTPHILNKYPHLKQLKKIIDYGGEWAKNCNSMYVGRALLDNGYIFRSAPQFVVKSFGQQCPLTMHMLDMSTLKSTWDPCYDKYYIK